MTIARTHQLVRSLIVLSVILATEACASRAGQPLGHATTWSAVEQLDANRSVEVETRTDVVRGIVIGVTSSSLHIRSSQGTMDIKRPDIVRVRVARRDERDSLVNGVLWGGAIGVGYVSGVLVGLAGTDDAQSAGGVTAGLLFGGAVGAGIGALVDAARSRPVYDVVYVAP